MGAPADWVDAGLGGRSDGADAAWDLRRGFAGVGRMPFSPLRAVRDNGPRPLAPLVTKPALRRLRGRHWTGAQFSPALPLENEA